MIKYGVEVEVGNEWIVFEEAGLWWNARTADCVMGYLYPDAYWRIVPIDVTKRFKSFAT